MSSEHRAHLLANDLLARGMAPILTHEARAVIAFAIREAQASARNEALEEAAVAAINAFCQAYGDGKPRLDTMKSIDLSIRSLKTKD